MSCTLSCKLPPVNETSASASVTAPVLPATLVTGAPAWLNDMTPVELSYVISPDALICVLTLEVNPDTSAAVICEPLILICEPETKFKLPLM